MPESLPDRRTAAQPVTAQATWRVDYAFGSLGRAALPGHHEETVSRKGAVGPLRLNPDEAAIAAAVIEERTAGVDLKSTPFADLPAFGRRLGKAVKRRRTNPTEIVMWTVDRNEAEAGYSYLMAFSHEDVPNTFLTFEQMDAVHHIALELVMALVSRRGDKGLDREGIARRLAAWDEPETSDMDVPNPRWVRRLKRRVARDDAFWQTARRSPLTPFALTILAPRKTTEN